MKAIERFDSCSMKTSYTALRVSDRSGTPQGCNQPEEYSGERGPEALRGDTPNTSTSSV